MYTVTVKIPRIVGIKAGSSIFFDESCFGTVADLIVSLTEGVGKIFFVVSALKGQTDVAIQEIAGEYANALNDGLLGHANVINRQYNTTDIAARLVAPENYSVRRLTEALIERGIKTIGLQHGPVYPLLGIDDGNFLYATPDIEKSRRVIPEYDARVVVVPGFGVRNIRGQVMCTGRGSSDLTLAHLGAVFDLDEIVYWKDTKGYLRNPKKPEEGIYESIAREQVEEEGAKVLERRVLKTFAPPIRITGQGMLSGGTKILPYETKAEPLYEAAAK